MTSACRPIAEPPSPRPTRRPPARRRGHASEHRLGLVQYLSAQMLCRRGFQARRAQVQGLPAAAAQDAVGPVDIVGIALRGLAAAGGELAHQLIPDRYGIAAADVVVPGAISENAGGIPQASRLYRFQRAKRTQRSSLLRTRQ